MSADVCAECGGPGPTILWPFPAERICAKCRTCAVCGKLVEPGQGSRRVDKLLPSLHGKCLPRTPLEAAALAARLFSKRQRTDA